MKSFNRAAAYAAVTLLASLTVTSPASSQIVSKTVEGKGFASSQTTGIYKASIFDVEFKNGIVTTLSKTHPSRKYQMPKGTVLVRKIPNTTDLTILNVTQKAPFYRSECLRFVEDSGTQKYYVPDPANKYINCALFVTEANPDGTFNLRIGKARDQVTTGANFSYTYYSDLKPKPKK